jgi:hypothetical protein
MRLGCPWSQLHLKYYPFDSNHAPLQSGLIKSANRDGLLIVFTYTNLTPGIWQIACALDDSPLARLQFDVLPFSFESDSEMIDDRLDNRLDDRIVKKEIDLIAEI